MKLALRMDDITPDMDYVKFERFRQMLDAHGICPLIGVVPENRDKTLHCEEPHPDFWEMVKTLQQRGWTVAMHGCYHIYTTQQGGLFPLNRLSEFAGLPEARQRELIRAGKEILRGHGIETDLFMAPAHSYDRTTLKVLREEGFARMTDGFGAAPYERDGLIFYPISFSRRKSLAGGPGTTTLVVHASTMSDAEFEQYEEIFRTQEMISYSEYLSQPAGRRSAAGHMKEYLMAAGKRTLVSLHQRGR
ncbi:MAG: DUF2334 domain-containing protein [Lachnospiraceae bacterium]|nr:DUF2334 domain-containing protein [Lachnospiraceae bacterium]